MIGKDGPGFNLPVEFFRDREKAALQDFQTGGASKMMDVLICGLGDKIGITIGSRCVGACGHDIFGSGMNGIVRGC